MLYEVITVAAAPGQLEPHPTLSVEPAELTTRGLHVVNHDRAAEPLLGLLGQALAAREGPKTITRVIESAVRSYRNNFV